MEEELAKALQSYYLLVEYLQRYTNPEEWATHGDWNRVQREARIALSKYDHKRFS